MSDKEEKMSFEDWDILNGHVYDAEDIMGEADDIAWKIEDLGNYIMNQKWHGEFEKRLRTLAAKANELQGLADEFYEDFKEFANGQDFESPIHYVKKKAMLKKALKGGDANAPRKKTR